MEEFLLYLKRQEKEVDTIISTESKKMKWDREAQERAKEQKHCYLCNKRLRYKYERYRDHDHLSGIFRGISCNVCNLKYASLSNLKIPIIMHNASGYDLHFIVRCLHAVNERISIIPKNTERFLSVHLGAFVFIDSFQFLSESLSTLANNLKSKSRKAFQHTSKHVTDKSRRELLLRKGVFCYRYLDDIRKFDDKKLPPIEDFYNDLNQEPLSKSNYEHALKVWDKFECRSLGDYHDLYLTSDLLILADIFQNFRRFCLRFYKLDPAHYLSGPQLSFDALLKKTGVELELLTDIDMYNFIEKGIRGGVAQIMQRYAKANNRYMQEYNKTLENSFLWYIDSNSLYAYVMQQHKLPIKGFKWMSREEINTFDVLRLPDDGEEGYILEVSLEYPEELHDIEAHKDFPLACEKLNVSQNDISPLVGEMRKRFGMKHSKVQKLIPNLQAKSRYTVHYRTLHLYLDLGMKLVEVHRGIKFQQDSWMAPYINFNINERQNASNTFDSSLFKFMSNAVFGKTVENVKKRVVVKLVSDEKKLEELASKPTFRGCQIIHEHLAGVHMGKPVVLLDRPIYVGFSILDIAKWKMYHFHYKYMAQKYGSRARLIFTDTDSFIYHIKTEDLYRDLYEDADLFDFCNYPPNHPLYHEKHKKEPGFFKDESCGNILVEFVGLGAKMYSLRHEHDGNERGVQKGKGVKKSIMKTLCHEDYVNCLFEMKQMRHSFHAIRSQEHQLYTIKQNKRTLSCYDDKRFIFDCNIHSLPYGHRAIKRKCLDDKPRKGRKFPKIQCDECSCSGET